MGSRHDDRPFVEIPIDFGAPIEEIAADERPGRGVELVVGDLFPQPL
jgi:hypothetical protein